MCLWYWYTCIFMSCHCFIVDQFCLIGIDFNRSGNLPTSYPSTLAHQVSFQCAEDGPLIGSTLVTWALTFSCSVGFVWQCDVFFTYVKLWHVLWRLSERLMIDSLCDYDQNLTQLWFKHGNLRTVWFNTILHTPKLRVPPLPVFGPLPRWVRACLSSSWSVDMIKYHQKSLCWVHLCFLSLATVVQFCFRIFQLCSWIDYMYG